MDATSETPATSELTLARPAPTDPTPYVSMAYTIGLGAILAYACFLMLQRRSLRRLLTGLEDEATKN